MVRLGSMFVMAMMFCGAMASSAEAQLAAASFSGNWELNIPQEPYGPATWAMTETAGVVSGTTTLTIEGYDVLGEMDGQKLFPFVYQLNSEFTLDADLPGLPDITLENRAVAFVFFGRVYGYGITTAGLASLQFPAVYVVTGRKK